MEKINYVCENCGNDELEVLKKKVHDKSFYYLVRCPKCGNVFEISDKLKLSQTKLIISRYDISESKVITIPKDVEYKVGDTLNIDGEELEITKIETDKTVKGAEGKDIKVIWTKSLSIPKKIGISINDKNRTYSVYLLVPNDYIFETERTYKINEGFFKIKKIKLENGKFANKAEAKDIKRIYGEVSRPYRNAKDLTEYLKED
ncbi:HVO_0476 family zinc finger protein [Methanocaldococcus indicus]|uniref:HVO_0476 family zinc finger protein n=1 Tax=Methanocaldococcus indicus TaxID=213231 RepID=UPI003C6CCCDF